MYSASRIVLNVSSVSLAWSLIGAVGVCFSTSGVLEVGVIDYGAEFDVGAWGRHQWADIDGHFELTWLSGKLSERTMNRGRLTLYP